MKAREMPGTVSLSLLGRRIPKVLVMAAVLFLTPVFVVAQTITIAIENKNFAPYTTWSDGRAGGACAEVAEGAVRHMGGTVEYVAVPWARVLWMVEHGKVDAALCGTHSAARAAYSHYPQEPLLHYDATLFVSSASDLSRLDPGRLQGKTFGVINGYSYAGADDELTAMGMKRREVLSRDILLRHLVNGKLDAVLDSVLPVKDEMKRSGLKGKIRAVTPSVQSAPAFLFFSKRDGNEALAQRFSQALADWKRTPEYVKIAERYGLF